MLDHSLLSVGYVSVHAVFVVGVAVVVGAGVDVAAAF